MLPKQRVAGIGGIFFKARDPKALAAWYQAYLGVPVEEGTTCARSSLQGRGPRAGRERRCGRRSPRRGRTSRRAGRPS